MTLILSGSINRKNEWRLDPRRSIEGGVAFVKYLTEYWLDEKNRAELSPEQLRPNNFTQIILASYNAGAARVKRSVKKYGDDLLETGEVSKLRSYTNKILSYCYHFSDAENKL